MKNIILLLSALLMMSVTQVFSQTLDNQFIFNIQRPVDSYKDYEALSFGPNLNFTFIQAYKPNRAYRIGIGINSTFERAGTSTPYFIGDTLVREILISDIRTPYIMVGKEVRKYIHPDLFVVSAIDFGAGAGRNKTDKYSIKEDVYGERATSVIYPSGVPNSFTAYAFARPSLGARISWGAFIMGYDISAPQEFLVGNSFGFNVNLKHEFSVGLKFFHRKELNKKFLMIKY